MRGRDQRGAHDRGEHERGEHSEHGGGVTASGLNAYWTQAVASNNGIMAGIILLRNIPIN